MGILDVEGLKFKYANEDLFNSVNFRVLPKDHIVIVGDNGAGKSTFMNLISKNLIPDSGTIKWENGVTYSYLDQHLKVNTDLSIYDYLITTFKDLFDREKKMNDYYKMLETCDPSMYDKYLSYASDINDYLEEHNFYQIDSTLGNVISGLGLKEYDLNTKLSVLSGGSRAKVYLAKLLLDSPDVLLMDEPTNFLDEAHVRFLAGYLKNYKKQFVVISHDEGFIREIAEVVYNLENKTLTRYNMDYEHFLIEKEFRKRDYENAYKKQQEYVKRTTDFINKNIVRATTTKRAQSRRKALEKLSLLEKPKNHEPMKIKFQFSRDLGDEVLKFEDLSVGYGEKVVLSNLNLLLKKNQKIAILGHNGVGKTTILKTIMGVIEPLGGSFKWNPSADINYFSQEEKYEPINALNYLRGFYHMKTDQELRSQLALTNIKGELATKPMTLLSGGEQTKVRLALMMMKKSNVLVLDEITNHLDMASKAELWEAIDEFPGSVIIVSHEDNFYEGLVDLVLNFE